MISGNASKAATSAEQFSPPRDDRLQRSFDPKYSPVGGSGLPDQFIAVTDRKVLPKGLYLENPAVYRQRASHKINSVITASGAAQTVPQFTETTPDITPHLNHLKTSSRGRHIIRLVEALCESVEISHEKKGAISQSQRYLNPLLRIALEANDCKSDVEAAHMLNIWCCQQLPRLLGINFTNFEVYKIPETEFLDFNEDALFNYLLFAVKTSNACSVRNLPIKPNMLAYFDMLLSAKVCGNPYGILSFEPRAFTCWTESFAPRQKLGIEIDGPLHIEAPYAEQLNELYWAEGFPADAGGVSHQLSLEGARNYLLHVLIPQDIKAELFPTSDAYQVTPGASRLEASDFHGSHRKLFLFGEEFEYSGLNIAAKNDLVRDDYKLKRWIENLEQKLKQKNIHDYSITPNTHNNLIYEIWVTIGNWECKVFADEENLEVIVTPYEPDQVFLVNGKPYTPYQCFDYFIHDVALDLSLKGVSGHRHMDIRHCLGGDKESLFRLMVDMEHHSWLPRAFGREEQSKFFKYALQHAEIQREKIFSMLRSVNAELKKHGASQQPGSFSDLCDLKSLFSCMYLWDHYGPCSMRHVEDEDHPPSIRVSPTSTVEFRFLPCAKDGEESRLISELLIRRIGYLHKCKQKKIPLKYEPVNPCDYTEDKDEAVILQFVEYIREMGEEPAKYRPLLRIPVPTHCEKLFESAAIMLA